MIPEADGTVTVSVPGSVATLSLKFSIADVLKIVTGAPSIPLIGFYPEPSIMFHQSSSFLMANTCGNTLHLPLKNVSDREFNYNIVSGIVRVWKGLKNI